MVEFREHAPALLLGPFHPPSRQVTIVDGHCLFGTPVRANSIRHKPPAIYFDLDYVFAALLHCLSQRKWEKSMKAFKFLTIAPIFPAPCTPAAAKATAPAGRGRSSF